MSRGIPKNLQKKLALIVLHDHGAEESGRKLAVQEAANLKEITEEWKSLTEDDLGFVARKRLLLKLTLHADAFVRTYVLPSAIGVPGAR